ncbi:hypothetical protein CAPTEDRAFT_77623, partial [Capitella teleta]
RLTEVPDDITWFVTSINLSYNSIPMLGPNALSNFTELERLELSFNNISFIHDDAFEGVNNLRHLNLSNNQLTDFPVLRNTPALNYLDLNDNKIRKIPDDALDRL